ncbi:twin-arginine translocase TatA/TatE family subunit [Salarchaeum japonicum]|uniref:twin-arginine translocase TatA/TatE family subunit n=1 Tax=Salarchaeum japonicum TaxID=555573 RepID=UPI003C7279E7
MLTAPAFIGGLPGGMEFAVILLLAVLLFGANKIPKLARSTGQAMGEFQKGREEVEQELEEIRDGDVSADSESEPSTDSDTDKTPTN